MNNEPPAQKRMHTGPIEPLLKKTKSAAYRVVQLECQRLGTMPIPRLAGQAAFRRRPVNSVLRAA